MNYHWQCSIFLSRIYNCLLHSKNLTLFDVPLFYSSVTFNEFKEKFRIFFCCFSAIKVIVAPSSSFNFPVKVEEYSYLFVLINLLQWVYNISDDTNNLINFLLDTDHFLRFQWAFDTLLLCCLEADQNGLLSINISKSFISTNGM